MKNFDRNYRTIAKGLFACVCVKKGEMSYCGLSHPFFGKESEFEAVGSSTGGRDENGTKWNMGNFLRLCNFALWMGWL